MGQVVNKRSSYENRGISTHRDTHQDSKGESFDGVSTKQEEYQYPKECRHRGDNRTTHRAVDGIVGLDVVFLWIDLLGSTHGKWCDYSLWGSGFG